MDITLVNCNMYYVRYLDGMVRRQNQLTLGPLYLISVLKEAGLDVDFRDYQLIEGEDVFEPEALCDFIRDPAPIIGLSCMANLLPFILHAMPALKQAYPDSIFLLGGIGPMSIEREILERVPELDVVHRGEGEASVPLLVRALLEGTSLETVPSIFYRRDGEIIQNPAAQRIAALDAMPRPSYDIVDFKRYQGHNILGSRGCPYPCTFCSVSPVWGWKPYARSSESIVAEMVHMHREYGVRQFLFQDEYFITGPERAIEFARLLMKEKLDICYKVFARVDLVNEDAIKALADSGCLEIRFGIESGSDRVLKAIKKGFDSATALKTVSLAKKHIKYVDTFFIWGFPFETIEDFSESLFQMITFRGMGVRVLPSMLTYLPQTKIYRDIADKSDLEFCPFLLPEYMIMGIEKRISVRIDIDPKHQSLFDYIMDNRDLFPGFFQLDIEENILPKLAMLEEFEFYRADDKCTGAHEPSEVEIALPLNT
ncbi:MAG: B12-binding domain-containing radical SAM protein [bacterium]|nr:B12-binding domain-containing radical SAM protein [bacterium]